MKLKSKTKIFLSFAVILAAILFPACKKKENSTASTAIEYGTVTDIDGNSYKTVKIRGQWWMAENLKVKTYRNGLIIKEATSTTPDTTWAHTTIGYFCNFQYNSAFSDVYGLLYNWYAVNDTSGLAPAGWHVATDVDWKRLEVTMGMSPSEANGVNWRGAAEATGLKVHSYENNSWTSYGNIYDDNSSGFTALGGACRLFNGVWADPNIKSCGFWWTSSTHPGNKAWFRNLDYKKTNVFRYYTYKSYGMSVRCVKD